MPHYSVVIFWWKSSTTSHFTIKISFIVVLVLYQVLQAALWLEASKVTFVTSFKTLTTFHYTTEISFIVVLILKEVLKVTSWLEVG